MPAPNPDLEPHPLEHDTLDYRVDRLDSDVRELRREASASRTEQRECRAAVQALEGRVGQMLDAYPTVAGMTAQQRLGAQAGVAGALVALATALPQILRAFGLNVGP